MDELPWSNDLAAAIVSGDDCCPKCLGELDTGFECIKCGFDAICFACGGPPFTCPCHNKPALHVEQVKGGEG